MSDLVPSLAMVLTTPNTPTSPTGQHHKQRRLSAVISDAARRSRERRKGPQSWFMLKLTIVIAAAIIAYTAYVYIGRLCIPMIKRERSSLGSRTMGSEYHNPLHTLHVLPTTTENKIVVFVAVFAVLGLMVIWAYTKVRRHITRLLPVALTSICICCPFLQRLSSPRLVMRSR